MKDRTTAEDFVVPSSTRDAAASAARGSTGAAATACCSTARGSAAPRGSHGASAAGGELGDHDVARTYAKYQRGLSRDFYLDAFQKIHLNGAWFGGRDLDRFAKYQFGLFDDTRIHGVPASGVRYGELAMARGSYSLNIFEQYRLDLFLDQAWGRDDPGRGAVAADCPASASRSTCARRGIRFSAPISARACCRRATARSARRRSRSCS